uniref:MADF domain-containing protein n=1 Tax=Timema genevievae TaxID=629358 RepID=A0A7R9KB98_TIMGE|nr:unnamed protein product [Timema genevievae]
MPPRIAAGDWKPCGLSSTKIIDEGFDLLDNGSLVLDVEDTSGEKTRNLVYPPSSFCSDSVYLVSCLPLRPSAHGATSNRHLGDVMWRASHFERNSMGCRIRHYLLETGSQLVFLQCLFITNEQELNVKFVGKVEKHPILYHFKLPGYARKDLTGKTWFKAGKEVNLSASECKDKWTNLRSVFVQNLKPTPIGPGSKRR